MNASKIEFLSSWLKKKSDMLLIGARYSDFHLFILQKILKYDIIVCFHAGFIQLGTLLGHSWLGRWGAMLCVVGHSVACLLLSSRHQWHTLCHDVQKCAQILPNVTWGTIVPLDDNCWLGSRYGVKNK